MSNRNTAVSGTTMHFDMWLRLASDGSAAMSRGCPRLALGDRSMKLRISVPRSIFTIPTLQATVKVPDNQPGNVLTAEVVQTAERALREAINMDVTITVGE